MKGVDRTATFKMTEVRGYEAAWNRTYFLGL